MAVNSVFQTGSFDIISLCLCGHSHGGLRSAVVPGAILLPAKKAVRQLRLPCNFQEDSNGGPKRT